jgi:malate dehydrogenase (quinone)
VSTDVSEFFFPPQNLDLVKYLVTEVFASKDAQLAALRQFVPDAKPEDWTMVWAGQRVQIVKPDPKVRT